MIETEYLIAHLETDVAWIAALALSIRTSDLVPPWRPSPVTLVGDAVHTMTPGRGAVVGPLTVFTRRSATRLLNRVPPAKRRSARSVQKVRDSELV